MKCVCSLIFLGAFLGMFFLYETSFWVGIYRRKWSVNACE